MGGLLNARMLFKYCNNRNGFLNIWILFSPKRARTLAPLLAFSYYCSFRLNLVSCHQARYEDWSQDWIHCIHRVSIVIDIQKAHDILQKPFTLVWTGGGNNTKMLTVDMWIVEMTGYIFYVYMVFFLIQQHVMLTCQQLKSHVPSNG
jgi:hypothetical protein